MRVQWGKCQPTADEIRVEILRNRRMGRNEGGVVEGAQRLVWVHRLGVRGHREECGFMAPHSWPRTGTERIRIKDKCPEQGENDHLGFVRRWV